jgi:glycerol-3-phosphate acyltransferase PlsX
MIGVLVRFPREKVQSHHRLILLTQQNPHITIAVDAMGGDFAPGTVVEGTLNALDESQGRFGVALIGPQDRIEKELRTHATRGLRIPKEKLTLVHAPDVISMEDAPNAALRTKKRSSIGVGLTIQKEGTAQAFVSAGNTGAVMSASTLILGRVKGVSRPTIGAVIPTVRKPAFLLDAGANVDCRPRHLFEFAVMGSTYMSTLFGLQNPRVGLLNIGEEATKGNAVALETFAMLQRSRLNFIGNIEGRDLLKGDVDVIVCDGFTGNILLKFGESVPSVLKEKFLAFAARNLANKLVAVIARGGLRSVLKEFDYQEHGGVPLLGVNGVSIIGHGGSNAKAIKNMIFRAEEMIRRNVNALIKEELGKYHE